MPIGTILILSLSANNFRTAGSIGIGKALIDVTRYHGSLEGVGGLKTNEAYHSKADALVIPEMYFFLKNYLRPFLEMLVL